MTYALNKVIHVKYKQEEYITRIISQARRRGIRITKPKYVI
jgi:hypothetical protein